MTRAPGVMALKVRCVYLCPAHRTEPPDSAFQSFTHSGFTQLLLDSSMPGGHRRKGSFPYSLWWSVWKLLRIKGLVRPELGGGSCLTVSSPTRSHSPALPGISRLSQHQHSISTSIWTPAGNKFIKGDPITILPVAPSPTHTFRPSASHIF